MANQPDIPIVSLTPEGNPAPTAVLTLAQIEQQLANERAAFQQTNGQIAQLERMLADQRKAADRIEGAILTLQALQGMLTPKGGSS